MRRFVQRLAALGSGQIVRQREVQRAGIVIEALLQGRSIGRRLSLDLRAQVGLKSLDQEVVPHRLQGLDQFLVQS